MISGLRYRARNAPGCIAFSSEVDAGSHSNQVYADCVDLSAVENASNQSWSPALINQGREGSRGKDGNCDVRNPASGGRSGSRSKSAAPAVADAVRDAAFCRDRAGAL